MCNERISSSNLHWVICVIKSSDIVNCLNNQCHYICKQRCQSLELLEYIRWFLHEKVENVDQDSW